jgi:hypothetical protein
VEFPVRLTKFSLKRAEPSDGSNELCESSRFDRCSTVRVGRALRLLLAISLCDSVPGKKGYSCNALQLSLW